MIIEAIQIRRGGYEIETGTVILSVCVDDTWVDITEEKLDSRFSAIFEESYIRNKVLEEKDKKI